ncbi:hypothetical protein M434DRAFT_16992 [Hypoxylon sp. CO27-5]|nr:hypothetical protein M434DRAFT_16992 [Hypoxylon sp. CO27-5]
MTKVLPGGEVDGECLPKPRRGKELLACLILTPKKAYRAERNFTILPLASMEIYACILHMFLIHFMVLLDERIWCRIPDCTAFYEMRIIDAVPLYKAENPIFYRHRLIDEAQFGVRTGYYHIPVVVTWDSAELGNYQVGPKTDSQDSIPHPI